MKKITLIIAFIFTSLQMSAQIAPGSVAPDFTVTDINGTVHSLSAYLAEGKTVIMDISATWCSPCWNFHNSHSLENIYEAYGPNASNEVVVLFVEGDAATTSADLNGTGTNTQGNWVGGTPYPIIDGTNIADLYEITYFPTLFRICPDGFVSEISAGAASSIRTSINTACGTLTGVQNHLEAIDTASGICSVNGSPVAKFKSYGENIITTANFNLKANGEIVATKVYNGTTPRFTERTVTFDPLVMDPSAEYTVEIESANGGPLFNPALGIADMDITLANQTTSEVVVKVYTDNWPTEISWKIKNSANIVVATGGPYTGPANGGGVNANTTITSNATLAINECYSVELLDAYGDGWSLGSSAHGLEVFANGVSVLNVPTGNFGTSLLKSNALTTTTLAVTEMDVKAFGLYPNPSSGIVRINTHNPVQVDVIDILGKTVYHSSNITGETSIDLSGLQKGVYIAKIVGENATKTEKVILK